MVNHFASLLSNLNLSSVEAVEQKFTITFGTANSALNVNGSILGTGGLSLVGDNRLQLPLIARDYTQLTLPVVLQRLYNVLFPSEASLYYKHFLLYNYLKTVALTERAEDIKIKDSRITYELEDIEGFFKFNKVNKIESSNPNYGLLVYGAPKNTIASRSFTQSYRIQQNLDSMSVSIFSETQGVYLHPSRASSKTNTGMFVDVGPNGTDTTISAPVSIGDTGLSFTITGNMSQLFPGFPYSANKFWRFSVDAAVEFSILEKIKELDSHSHAIEAMFDYARTHCTRAYENLWYMHYNPVYRLAGLLLGYVERVDAVWQKLVT